MAKRLTRIKQSAIKQESVSGTAETLAATDVPLTFIELSSKFEREMNERNPLQSHLSGNKSIPGIGKGEITSKIELVAGGDATTKPACDPFLLAMGLQTYTVSQFTMTGVTGTFQPGEQFTDGGTKEGRVIVVTATVMIYAHISGSAFIATDTITGTNSAGSATISGTVTAVGFAYSPKSETSASPLDTFTQMVNDDGVATEIFGALGTGQISVEAPGRLAYLNATLSGAAIKPADLTLYTAAAMSSMQDIVPETFLSAAVSIGGDSLCISGLNFDIGNSVEPDECANSATGISAYAITDRKPKITVAPLADLEASVAFWSKYDGATSMPFTATIGSSASKRVVIVAANCTYEAIPYGDRNGKLTYDAALTLNGDRPEGDDEFFIAFI